MSNFDPNAILRGAQLTLVGAHRALQNPNLFKHDIYRQAAIAVAIGVAIHIIVSIPVLMAKGTLYFLGLFTDLQAATWDERVVSELNFLQNSVLQVPFFLMSLLRTISPAMDDLFMQSLDWVDRTYIAKHESDEQSNLRAMYCPNLSLYHGHSDQTQGSKDTKRKALDGLTRFFVRFGRKAGVSLTIMLLSYVPYIGKFVIPGVSFYYFKTAVGDKPAIAVFASGLILPRRYVIRFLQTYFSSRTMMRELLQPYFSRVPFTPAQKKQWFLDREGVLFGFGVAFFLMLKIPLVGVLVYGIAEASTAYLVTKITDPPPPPAQREAFVAGQVRWHNKVQFLSLPLDRLDKSNVQTSEEKQDPLKSAMPTGRKFL